MEPLLDHLDRFSEVLAVARTAHVASWDPATVRRALEWARYLRHVHGRFGRHGRIRAALERRLQRQGRPAGSAVPGPAPGLTSFQSLGRCDLLLAASLLENRALGDAACRHLLQQLCPGPGGAHPDGEEPLPDGLARLARRAAAVRLLRLHGLGERRAPAEDALLKTQAELLLERLQAAGEAGAEGPRGLLGRLWARLPHGHLLKVLAAALLLPPAPAAPQDEGLGPARPQTPSELGAWLLGHSDIMEAFCRTLPARLLASVAGRHPALASGYLGLLTEWGRRLHYDLQKGHWVGAEPHDLSWEELCDRFQSLLQAPPPLNDDVLTTLKACKAADGDFEVPGLSIWTDLLVALDTARGQGHVEDLRPGPRALHPMFS
ncbi:Fanconi anemia group F protein [Tenrec ecaudatus]|uniref:Fanconi anemia group F protein n=1 Tax=Tenrec ecaudatus TaxID=94439 RepID=UPI003F5A8FD2